MIRKKVLFGLILISTFLPTLAQTNWWDFGRLYMPSRDTNNIRIIREYGIDSTGKRTLMDITEYDRHGYQTNPYIKLTYNDKGQLIHRLELIEVGSVKNPIPHLDTSTTCDISYNAQGQPEAIRWVYYLSDTYVSHALVQYSEDSLCQKLRYRTTIIRPQDTFTYTATALYRCFDNQGRLIQFGNDEIYAEESYFHINYTYDNEGRIATRQGGYYEDSDSLVYHYDSNGKLTSITGIAYSTEGEVDILIHCRPDGTRKEEWRHYRNIYDDTLHSESDDHILYDTHGNITRWKSDELNTIFEYEIEYWE